MSTEATLTVPPLPECESAAEVASEIADHYGVPHAWLAELIRQAGLEAAENVQQWIDEARIALDNVEAGAQDWEVSV